MNRSVIDKNKALMKIQMGMAWCDPRFKFCEGTNGERNQSFYEHVRENTLIGKLLTSTSKEKK